MEMLPGHGRRLTGIPGASNEEKAVTQCPTPNPAVSVRINPDNPNHHLWDNNGTWFVHYTVYPTPITKERVRRSLCTKCLKTARRRRDALLARLTKRLVMFRCHSLDGAINRMA